MGGVGYTYIRKNACSVFKKIIVETSEFAEKDPDLRKNPMAFMGKYHKVTPGNFSRLKLRIVVLRNPVERIVSGYISQFLMRLERPTPEMHGSIETLTSVPSSMMTFEIFVQNYLSHGPKKINAHFAHQYLHMAPVEYTDVLSFENLFSDAEYIFGKEVASKYFSRPINATYKFTNMKDPKASQRTAKYLMEHFQETRSLPEKSCFLTPKITNALNEIYHFDLDLYKKYEKKRTRQGNRPVSLKMD